MTPKQKAVVLVSVKLIEQMGVNFPDEDPMEGREGGLMTAEEAYQAGALSALYNVSHGIRTAMQFIEEKFPDEQ
jgi:hypothetical protein